MRIVCISDLHGYLPKDLPDGDVLVIAGDICPAYDHSIGFQKQWIEGSFNQWIRKQNQQHKVFIAGNHDFVFEHYNFPQFIRDDFNRTSVHYLHDSEVILDGYKFYGYPWQIEFCDWAFNLPRHEMADVNAKVPFDVNVLITHGPAFKIHDAVTEGWNDAKDLGDPSLNERIKNLSNLKLHVCGHIHSGHGKLVKDGVTYVNASLLNEDYKRAYEPEIVDI